MKKMKIGEICIINPKMKDNLSSDSLISFIPMSAVSTNGKVELTETMILSKAKNYTLFGDGDILFAKITPCMENGKGAIAHDLLNGYGAGSTEFIVLRPNTDVITAKWLYLYLSQRSFRWECQQHMTGSAGQKRVPPKYLASCEIPVPPVPEQERIVSKIEELFSKLDASVAELQIVKEKLKVYRQAVLKEAFSTCEEYTKISDVCQHVTDGDHMPPPKADNGIPFIMISNIEKAQINWKSTKYVTEDYYKAIGELRTPRKGDILYTVTGSFGIPVIVDFDKKFCFQRHIALLRPNEKIAQKYLFYVLQTPHVYMQASKRATGTAQKTVGLSVLRNITIPYCSTKKQIGIIEFLEQHLTTCDSIEQTIDTSLQQAEALRQSILKQTFEGRLV